MNRVEATTLCRLVAAYCPQQTFDEYTPDAWHDLLSDLRFEDARQAAAQVARTQNFVSPAEIRTGVRKLRDARLAAAPPYQPPADLDTGEYLTWLRSTRAAVADGTAPPEDDRELVPARDVKALIGSAFRRVPRQS